MVLTIYGTKEKTEIGLNISCIGCRRVAETQNWVSFIVYLTKEQKDAIQHEHTHLELYTVCKEHDVYCGHLDVLLSDICYEVYDNAFYEKIKGQMTWEGL